MDKKDEFQKIRQAKIKTLEALRNKPTTYYIKVIDPTALPEKLKSRKEIAFIVRPPTFATLTQIALVVEKLPAEIFESVAMTSLAMRHMDSIVEMIAILGHGDPNKDMPSWYVPFLKTNLTINESLMIWHESAMKLQTDFFLPFFQTARLMNPMTMKTRTKTGTTETIHLD